LIRRFRELGIDAAALRRMTGRSDNLLAPLTPTRETLYSDSPAAIAVRCFFCGVPITDEEARRALGTEELDTALLTRTNDGHWRSPYHVRPALHLFLWSDYLQPGGDTSAVMGAGETTAVLYRAALPYSRIGSALDLGCGAGTLALLLANLANRAIGTDINERAVEISRLNARLNEVGNAEFRAGSLYEPVAAERFDLIVSQPPYYPDPESETSKRTFLHGGRQGHELASRVVAEAPDHLTESGRALVFSSWPEGTAPPHRAGLRTLNLRTNRRELNGTRQSITVVEHAADEGWSGAFDVSAEAWGAVTRAAIDEIVAVHELLRQPDDVVIGTPLRLPSGTELLREGDDLILRAGLAGMVPITERDWDRLQGGLPRDAAFIRSALQRGLLRIR
jgi:methylase of polypeptide subunit release factors